MHTMKKDSFIMNLDADTGKRYITKKDELTKNHKADTEGHSGMMIETGTEDCPVSSFLKLLSKLHPGQDRLWCYPRDSFRSDDEFWFTAKPMGVHPLSTFMKDLSKKCGLSKIYTNHSLRATAATVLHNDNFSASTVQSITGHKSVSSLSIYQRTSTKQKMQMASSLHRQIAGQEPRQCSKTVTTAGLSHNEEGGQFSMADWNTVFSDENEPVDFSTPAPVFRNLNNCTINISYNFK